LGDFEQIVLLAVLRLDDNAYGVTIRKVIRDCTDRNPAPGALYNTLDRLESKGMLTSYLGDPTPQRGGRPKRLFAVTRSGIDAVSRAQRAYQKLLTRIELPGVVHV
jgi:PadR family transcriptional regulator, regulatory protein PadR